MAKNAQLNIPTVEAQDSSENRLFKSGTDGEIFIIYMTFTVFDFVLGFRGSKMIGHLLSLNVVVFEVVIGCS